MRRWALLFLIATLSALPTYAGTITGVLQGPSGLPVKNSTLTFTLQQVGLISGTGAVANTTAQCWTDANGNVVGAPNPLVLANMAANYGSGTLSGGTYYVVYTFLTANGQSAPSPEARIQLTGTGSIVIQPPASIPANVTGINVYIGTTSGGETAQATQGTTSVYTQSTPLVSGSAPPSSNTSICSIAFNDTIIPYSGYSVSLTSSTGNSYPGWPQQFQLNGGASGTINVSQGAPLWNGTVIYPMPILSQPLNHGPQSIGGNLDFGGYNVTNVGILSTATSNTVMYPARCSSSSSAPPWCQGTEIGAWSNAALTSCGQNCELDIESGSYTQTTSIIQPLNALSTYRVKLLPGAVLNYTGSGCAFQTSVIGGPTEGNFEISGGQVNGTSAGQAAVCVMPTNTFHIHDMTVAGFSNGRAFWIEGANAGTIDNNYASNNGQAVYATPTYCNGATCGTSPVANPYTPNAVDVVDNSFPSNGWGVEYFDLVSAALSGPLLINIKGNDLENESLGGVLIGRSHSANVEANYFEGDPVGVQLGVPAGANFWSSQGARVVGNFFTVTAGMVDDILLDNTIDAIIDGNAQNYGGSETSSNCMINGISYNASVSGGELNTYVGHNHAELASVGNYLCENGTGVVSLTGAGSFSQMNTQYQSYIADQAFMVNTTVTSETVGLGYVTASGSCQLHAPAGNTTAIQNTRAALIAGTMYLSAIANGQVTLAHPSGSAMSVDILCENNPNGGYQ